jgi:hypothetical protein
VAETRKDYVRVKDTVFWDITPCSPLKVKLTFRMSISLLSSGSNMQLVTCFYASILLGLLDVEEGDDVLFRNVG